MRAFGRSMAWIVVTAFFFGILKGAELLIGTDNTVFLALALMALSITTVLAKINERTIQ